MLSCHPTPFIFTFQTKSLTTRTQGLTLIHNTSVCLRHSCYIWTNWAASYRAAPQTTGSCSASVALTYFFVKLDSGRLFVTKAKDNILCFWHGFLIFLLSEHTPPGVSALSPAGVKVCCRPSPGRKPTRSGPTWRSFSARSSPPSSRTARASSRRTSGGLRGVRE